MKHYTITQLSKLAGVSVRTLRYYDEIGLLKPSGREDNNYRTYSKTELIRLQQIMFYKALGLTLEEVKKILDDPKFDQYQALLDQREKLKTQIKDSQNLLSTINHTIKNYNQPIMLTDSTMYDGFTPEQREAYREEVKERWGAEPLAETEANIKKLNLQQWQALKKEGQDIVKTLATLMDHDPAAPEVQAQIEAYRTHLSNFYPVTKERYAALGKLYVEDERFTAYYEKYAEGLAEFVNKAIQIYCQN